MRKKKLIEKAREHVREFYDSIKDKKQEHSFTPPEALTDIRIRKTVMVTFSRDSRSSRADICLDRDTGEFVGATFSPEQKDDNAASYEGSSGKG